MQLQHHDERLTKAGSGELSEDLIQRIENSTPSEFVKSLAYRKIPEFVLYFSLSVRRTHGYP